MISRYLFASVSVLVLLVCSSSTVSATYEIPFLRVRGTHAEIGVKIGQHFGVSIRHYIASSRSLQEELLPFVETPRGFTIFSQLVETSSRAFPRFRDELNGIARGSGVSEHVLLVLSLQLELRTALHANSTVRAMEIYGENLACSDIFVHTPHSRLLAHNEDANPLVYTSAYLIDAHVFEDEGNRVYEKRYLAYTYPGYLAGNAFGYNAHGLVLTTNAVFPSRISSHGIGRNWLTRAILDSESIHQAVELLEKYRETAYGVSINIASTESDELLNIESAPNGTVSILRVDTSYDHFNMYKHSPSVVQIPDPSSIHRQARADELPRPDSIESALRILGDTNDPQYPIYRNGQPPDGSRTVATAVFDLDATNPILSIFTDNPLLSKPVQWFKIGEFDEE